MKHVKLDRIDLRILQELQKDGRMTNVDLAKQAGISAPPCLRRVRALEEAGYIRSYHANLAADKLGYKNTHFILVSLLSHASSELAAFIDFVNASSHVRECYKIEGGSDVLLKVTSKDEDDYLDFYKNCLSCAPNYGQGRALHVLEHSKYEPGIPMEVFLINK